MIAATIAQINGRGSAKLLVVDARAAYPSSRELPSSISCSRRSRDRKRRRNAASKPVRHPRSNRKGRSKCGWPAALRSCPKTARFTAVVFGSGDFRTPTELAPLPPRMDPGDSLRLGPLNANVTRVLAHPRLIELRFQGTVAGIWEGLARHGRPIQYAHVREPLAMWNTWTRIAGPPVAFEPPSAGFILDWAAIRSIRSRGAAFATVTHAAGISSTGDAGPRRPVAVR